MRAVLDEYSYPTPPNQGIYAIPFVIVLPFWAKAIFWWGMPSKIMFSIIGIAVVYWCVRRYLSAKQDYLEQCNEWHNTWICLSCGAMA